MLRLDGRKVNFKKENELDLLSNNEKKKRGY